ncbi:MAG: hypothetical protein HN534_05310 [Euryarchaeota archaeon]|jgi:SepF-like predicted cell division protein (DUF552 family)|nr:hypothetical protein [Euryarchaeota archaeon]MBT3654328.1 hypothetical protein [Euryarchaeota archaeon]MBT3757456.1 hypothetical protein [Euryarchaeota archaeon]MBT4050548.1 hypothetical protein [Euryarchaeota archaeon]MBT4346154.1 hypothetical protein [Euryarchaeota archaeon]
MARGNDVEPRWINMPSIPNRTNTNLSPEQEYHDLADKYPQAPVPRVVEDTIIHRAVLDDITGTSELMNWVADGDIVIVEMSGLVNREVELHAAVKKLQQFIEGDLSGTVFGIGRERLLLLPPTFSTKKGME